MTPEKQQQLQQHLNAIAEILYEEADSEKIKDLEGIEETIRKQTLEYITPELGFFLLKKQQTLKPGD
ncbi:MAG: hypothetical protein J7647_10270 [Cyanobacteria bacterium SBLK]|nr:hypothetical protein [Cyanobacteria bacterium SBLK]